MSFGLALSLVVGEIFIRVYKSGTAYQPDSELIRSLRPNITRQLYSYDTSEALTQHVLPDTPELLGDDHTNNLGFRMKEDVGPKAAGERRVMILGDSYTEAQGWPEAVRFHGRLDDWLEQREGAERWRAINAGIQNGNPSQYILQLRKYLPIVEPDVVLAVIGGNDLHDDLEFERIHGYAFDARGIPQYPESRVRLWLLQKSWLLRYVEVLTSRFVPGVHAIAFPEASPETQSVRWEALYCRTDAETRSIFRDKTGRYLQQLARLSREAGASFGVFLIHYMWLFEGEPLADIFPARFGEVLVEYGCDDGDVSDYNAFMEGYLGEQGIPFWNSYEAFARSKREAPARKLWGFADYHFSDAGHALVAEEMQKFLTRLIE